MHIDERIEALTMNLELASRGIQDLRAAQREGFAATRRVFETVLNSIKSLENIAVAHEQRLDDLEKH
jgi:hypothetical protein